MDQLTLEQKLISFYGDFGVEMLVLRPSQIEEGSLETRMFKRRLKRAIFDPCSL